MGGCLDEDRESREVEEICMDDADDRVWKAEVVRDDVLQASVEQVLEEDESEV